LIRKLYSLAIVVIFLFYACTKIETTTIGYGLIPPIDGVTTLDTTLDVFTNNFIDPLGDSAKIYKTDDHIIGTITEDPLFGKTTATAYFELKPTTYPFSLPNTPELKADSAVLILSYKGVFGDPGRVQRWEVDELNETLKGDTVYNVSKSFTTKNVIGSKDVDITTFDDSVHYGFEDASNQIRIKLSGEFASRLMNTFDSAKNGAAYANDSLFRENFKGFAVKPVGGSGNALVRINLLDTNTKLALFYNYHIKDSATSKRDTGVTYFRFSDGSSTPVSGSANYIKRERRGSDLQASADQYNPARNDSFVYIQTMPGSYATLKIPGLKMLPNAIIHRAELLTFQAPANPVYDQVLTVPAYLMLNAYDSSTKRKINVHNDYIITSGAPNITTFGGYPFDKDVPGSGIVKAYTFDISRYVQGIVTRKDSIYTLMLSAPSNDSLSYTAPYPVPTAYTTFYITPTLGNQAAIGRVRLGGGGMAPQQQLRMRLRIIYSKI
jgi:hypothetical protein